MEKINQLVEQLKVARNLYYSGNPIYTDAEFDVLESQLKSLDPKNDYFKIVGEEVRGIKKKHTIPMGSLNQLNDYNDINRWFKNVDEDNFILSDKLDGNSIALYYDEYGNFSHALTRGNGIEGLDITRHIKRGILIPKLFYPHSVVRCEAIIKKETFEENIKGYKNPRNYVAGQLNRKIADDDFIKYVEMIAFDADIFLPRHKSAILSILKELGFNVVKWSNITKDSISSWESLLDDKKKRSPYEIDGLVIEVNNSTKRNELGFDALNPKYAFKFKINKDFVETKVVAVHWQASKDGYLKPRVEFEPVELNGTTIRFATGFNAKFIVDNNVGIDSIIKITKSGDVIPYIEEVIQGTIAVLPNEEFAWNETGVDIILNEMNEDTEILKILDFFTSISAPILKKGNIKKLYDAGYNSIESIIKATEDEFVSVLGENGYKAYSGLRTILSSIEEHILAGSLPFFGRGNGRLKMQKIVKELGDVASMTNEKILEIDGFEEKSARKIMDGKESYLRFLNEMKDFIHIKQVIKSGELSDLYVCFSGVRDKELEKRIAEKGGNITNSVNKQTNLLVVKDVNSKSSKTEKAKELNIDIVDITKAKEMF